MGLVNIYIYPNRIKWDLGVTADSADLGHKGTILKSAIIEMVLIQDSLGGGVEISMHKRGFKPLKAMQGVLSVWDCSTETPIEYSPSTDLELYNLLDNLF